MFSSGGVIRTTVLVNGFVRGVRRLERTRGGAALVVEAFGPLPGEACDALADEGGELLRFAAPDRSVHDIRFRRVDQRVD